MFEVNEKKVICNCTVGFLGQCCFNTHCLVLHFSMV